MKIKLLILVAVFAGLGNLCAAGEDVESDKRIESAAGRVISGLRGPYAKAALNVSPGRLPDAVDYAIDKPMGIRISFPLDDFKHDYCGAVPVEGALSPVAVSGIVISDAGKKTVKRGVVLDSPGLVSAVKNRVDDFRLDRASGRYSYSFVESRRAVLKASAGQYNYELEFSEVDGEWLLRGIELIPETDERGYVVKIETMEFGDYYADCLPALK